MPRIPIAEYDYELPEDRIAQQALTQRDASKLMFYNGGEMSVRTFTELPDILHNEDFIVFNNTKVIPARLFASNSTGAKIEIFILHPLNLDHQSALASVGHCEWECLIGNSRKWKESEVLEIVLEHVKLKLVRLSTNHVRFEWDAELHFSVILVLIGRLPLPPYIRHDATDEDARRYQTVFSKIEGSVAAPTAGLHFTDGVLERLATNGISKGFITLHVGAGTFLPVKVEDATEHPMHAESFDIGIDFIRDMMKRPRVIAVGTTVCRVLESLYQLALNLKEGLANPAEISQFSYQGRDAALDRQGALAEIEKYMIGKGLETLSGKTSIMIVPGYKFRMIDGLVTNFHQPKSTLLLLIAALIGDDWKKVYRKAMESEFRFLSYGDSSLLLP